MKRVISILTLIITLLSILVSCVPTVPPAGCDTHIDLNRDTKCDFCGEEVDAPTREYTAFTTTERKKLVGLFGVVIPFMPCDEYILSDYNASEYGDVGVNYYVKGATSDEFDAYLLLFSDYKDDGTAKDDDGNTWYFFAKDDFYVDLAFYTVEGGTVMDLYAYTKAPPTGDDSGNQGGDPDDSGNQGGDADDSGNQGDGSGYLYTEFEESERTALFSAYGFVIPFIACNDYYFSSFADAEIEGDGHALYAYDNTEAEFNTYLNLFYTLYTFDYSEEDEDNDTWYYFIKGDYYIDVIYYQDDYGWTTGVFIYPIDESDSGTSGGSGNQGGNTGTDTDYENTAFTSGEYSMLLSTYGFVIPYLPNDEYSLDTFAELDIDGEGHVFYTYGNTETEFFAYLDLFYDLYTFDGTETDNEDDTWYYFTKGDYYIDVIYYQDDYGWATDVYIYPKDDSTGGGSSSGSGNQGGADYDDTGLTHFLNDGKGLPESKDGIYSVDFTTATNVKDVTDQGYYLDGCPPVGSPSVLVVPVQFTDAMASGKGFSIDVLKNAFDGDSDTTDYYSVWEYYYLSSYGQLDINFTILDEWYTAEKKSSYYGALTDSDGYFNGDQILIDEILQYLDPTMDLSQFDSDGNEVIDAIIIINTLDINYDVDMQWAYRYWNMYTDDDGNYYEYDGVSANDFLWASYQFLFEDEFGDFDDKNAVNTYTYIHEFGHILGLDDYYDTSDKGTVLDGNDIMDSEAGDHNPYSKFNLGWITTSRLVVTDTSVTLNLSAFGDTGDTVIIANNWDDALGLYQEYYIVIYYTETELNSGEGGYFGESGILVYHISASIYMEEYDGEIYYDVYNNNTDGTDQRGTKYNLVELVADGGDDYVYGVGDSLPVTHLDNGDALIYTFTVDAISANSATITFSKAA